MIINIFSKQPKYSAIEFANVFSAIFALLFMVVPYLQGRTLGSSYSLIMKMLMGIWLASSVLMNKEWILKIKKEMAFVVLLLLFYAIVVFIGVGNIKTYAIMVMAPYFGYFVFYYYYSTGKTLQLIFITKVLFCAFLITFFTTSFAADQYAYREIKDINEIIANNYASNIGTTHHVYAGVLLGTVLFSFLQAGDIRRIGNRVLLYICAGFSLYFSITSSSAIAVVCGILSIGGLIIQRQKKLVRLLLILLIVLGFLLLRNSVASMLQNTSSTIDNKYISGKVYDLGESIASGSSTGEFAARTRLWKEDWETFKGSFFMGIGSYYAGAGNGTYQVRDHSQLLSDAARYGFIFTAYMGYLFLLYTRLLKRLLESYGLECNLSTYYLIFLIMYFCQPIFTNFVLPTVSLFLVPGLVITIGEEKVRIS